MLEGGSRSGSLEHIQLSRANVVPKLLALPVRRRKVFLHCIRGRPCLPAFSPGLAHHCTPHERSLLRAVLGGVGEGEEKVLRFRTFSDGANVRGLMRWRSMWKKRRETFEGKKRREEGGRERTNEIETPLHPKIMFFFSLVAGGMYSSECQSCSLHSRVCNTYPLNNRRACRRRHQAE